MKHTWADPKTQWIGFHRYQRYWLDSEKVLKLSLTRRVDGKEVPTTVGEIYESLKGRHFENEEALENTLGEFGGVFSFPHDILAVLLALRNDGFKPFDAQWFFYDHTSGSDSPAEFYTFFVVCDGKIVREEVRLMDTPESKFDPSVLESGDQSWLSGFEERTIAQLWYRKFYAEMFIGQMLLARSPVLRWKFGTTTKTNVLLCILVVLCSLILIRLWR